MAVQHNTEGVASVRAVPDPFGFLNMVSPAWTRRGLCAQTDPEMFFPEKGGSTREAKATCARCPVAAECLDFALDNEERYGIWGGMSERDRRKLVKKMRGGSAPDSSTKTHCVNGHEMTDENTLEHPDLVGSHCRTCVLNSIEHTQENAS